jgi:hypothetical protein
MTDRLPRVYCGMYTSKARPPGAFFENGFIILQEKYWRMSALERGELAVKQLYTRAIDSELVRYVGELTRT